MRDQSVADYAAHMDNSFGAGHLGQTVLPNTVSWEFRLKRSNWNERNIFKHITMLIFRCFQVLK